MNKEIAEEFARHLERTAAADAAPRCKHVKMNGVRCGSPALRRQPFCWFHERLYNPPFEDEFPLLEDANAIQVGIMQVLDGLRRKRIDTRSAATMLYGLQTASANARRTNLEPSRSSVVLADPLTGGLPRMPQRPNKKDVQSAAAAGGEKPQ